MCGSIRYERWLGYPLQTPSAVAPESLLGHLRSSRGSFVGRVSAGVTRDPRGGSPRALGGVFDSLKGYTAFSNGIASDFPFLQKSFVLEAGLWTLAGRFCLFEVAVVTYSRWSERHCPRVSSYRVIQVRTCSPEAFSSKRG